MHSKHSGRHCRMWIGRTGVKSGTGRVLRCFTSRSAPVLHNSRSIFDAVTRKRAVLRVCAADDADKSLDELRKTTGFGRGKALSDSTKDKLGNGTVDIQQAAWADGGGFTGVWKGYMQSARDKFVVFRDQTVAGEAVDPFMWCLELAAEDDALSTHSVVELPVKSFEKRVDSLVTEFVNNYLPDDKAPLSVARAVEVYLFKTKGYKKADKQRVIDNEMYSPFRVYMNNVLPQMCGAPSVLAAMYVGVLLRLKAKGHLEGEVRVILPVLGGIEGLPFAQLPDEEVLEGCVEATPEHIMADNLLSLKMGYWPWEWVPGSKYGFLAAAQAAIGTDGRFGRGLAGVFVPPKGRAYGDVKRAFNSCERLVLLRNDSFEKRDYGVLLYHMNRNTEAYAVLKEFKENYDPNTVQIPIAGFESGPVATEYEMQLLDDILKQLEVQVAESALNKS